MKKKTLSLALALAMCLSLAVPAFAAEKTIYLDGYNMADDSFNAKVNEVSIEASQLSLTGDLTKTGEVELREFIDSAEIYTCPVYTANGPVEVVLTDGYVDGEDTSDSDEEEGFWIPLSMVDAKIDTVTYDPANKSVNTIKEHALYFDGNIACTMDGESKVLSLKEFYETPNVWDKIEEIPCISKGAKATLTEPGTYCVSAYYAAAEGGCIAYVIIPETEESTDPEPTTPPAETIPASGTAVASTQTVTVDGKAVEFQMYALVDENGNGTNYIKLRDMAYVLNGTKAQFSVGYDNATKTISVAGGAYEANGAEMTTPYSGDRAYTGGTQTIQVNGEAVDMTAITLLDDAGGGYNYFKLRDLGAALGFNVGWSKDAGVFIESDKPYAG